MIKKISIIVGVSILCTFGLNAGAVKAESKNIAIDATHFPDGYMRTAIRKNADKNKDGMLSDTERQKYTYLWLRGTDKTPIKSLKGIELFPNINSVYVNSIQKIDNNAFDSLKKLDTLRIKNYRSEELDLSRLSKLKKLNIDDSVHSVDGANYRKLGCIKKITFPKNLKSLTYSSDCIKEIDFSQLSKVEELSIECTKLTNFNTRNLTKLKTLYIDLNFIIELDVSKNKELRDLICYFASNRKIDLSNNKKLESIDIQGCNNLEKVKLPKTSKKAKGLDCKIRGCVKFSKCNFNDARNITSIEIQYSNFTKFSASKLQRLTYLDVSKSPKLKTVSVIKNKNLHYIITNSCPVQKLVLWKNKKLLFVRCKHCKKLKLLYLPKGKKVEVHKDKKTKIKRVR